MKKTVSEDTNDDKVQKTKNLLGKHDYNFKGAQL